MRNASRRLRHEVFERDATARSTTALRFAIETLATLRDFARRRRVFDDEQLIARHRHALEAEHLHRNRRTGLLHRLAALVEQRANAAGVHAADEVVADLSVPFCTSTVATGPLPAIELRFDDGALARDDSDSP